MNEITRRDLFAAAILGGSIARYGPHTGQGCADVWYEADAMLKAEPDHPVPAATPQEAPPPAPDFGFEDWMANWCAAVRGFGSGDPKIAARWLDIAACIRRALDARKVTP